MNQGTCTPHDHERHLPVAQAAIAAVCRRYALSPDEAEDFSSVAIIHILDDDYAVLRKFRGESKLATYLRMVVQRKLLDWRVSKWGKWRPCALAKRLGEEAVQLDCLINRDGLKDTEAIETMMTRFDAPSRERIEALAEQLPRRQGRPRIEGGEDAELRIARASAGDSPEDSLTSAEQESVQASVQEHLRSVIEGFSAEDRLLLQLHYFEGVSVAAISRMLGLEQRQLYPRIKARLKDFRTYLIESGLDATKVGDLLRWKDLDISIELDQSGSSGPSKCLER